MADRTIDLASAEIPPASDLAFESELSGRRTLFLRNGRPVAVMLSHDEYLALKETLALSVHTTIREELARAEAEALRGSLLAMEDLLVE